MLAAKMKDVPEEYRDKLIGAIEKNPELFKKIAEETQEKMKSGKDEMTAAQEVMAKYQDQLKGMLG